MKKADVLIDEIIQQASQVPLECQEKILDILRGMVFTKRCLIKEFGYLGENNESNITQHHE